MFHRARCASRQSEELSFNRRFKKRRFALEQLRRYDWSRSESLNPNASGWYSGSDHIHMNYGGNLHNTPENLMMLAQAEWLNVIGEKVANKDHRIFDHQHFTGSPHKLSTATQLLSFGEEYRPPFYGHINFINMKHLISPFTTGYEGSGDRESCIPSNTDIFRSAEEQGAIGGYVHPWSSDPERAGYAVARGFPVDLALGSFTYLEVLTRSPHFTVHGSGLASCAELRIQGHRLRLGKTRS